MKARIGLALGPAFLLLTLVLPAPDGMEPEAWRVAGLGLLMAAWWVSEAVPVPATALLPLALLPVLGAATIEAAAAPFANPIIFLFMGGFMIAQAMQRWDLHRRLAFAIILRTGTGPTQLVAGFMAAAAFLSMWVSNTAVAVMMLPIGLSVIEVLARNGDGPPAEGAAAGAAAPTDASGTAGTEPSDDPFAVALLLGIAYACSIGGVATLIGTPPNALLAGFLSDELGVQIGFARWLLVGLPMTLVLLPVTWVLLTRVVFKVHRVDTAVPRRILEELQDRLGPVSAPEVRVAWVFGGTALLWILRPVLEGWLPGISDAGIAMAATLVLFLLPAGGTRSGAVMDWGTAREIPWGILILFGGGLSLAAAISESGLAAWIGQALGGAAALPLVGLLVLVAAVVIFLTELTSNTATTAAFVPILAGLALAIGQDPVLITVVAALAASCAFMLPVATPPNAIVFGSERIRMGHMVRAGFILNLVVIVLVPLVGLAAAGWALEGLS